MDFGLNIRFHLAIFTYPFSVWGGHNKNPLRPLGNRISPVASRTKWTLTKFI